MFAFNSDRYHNKEVWYDKEVKELHPGMSHFVGGNTKIYGVALFRLREQDFQEFPHKDGISPAWPLKYADFEPYYTQAEELYQVHGRQGLTIIANALRVGDHLLERMGT
jgi:choline dehydrogenase-like flavoprotein